MDDIGYEISRFPNIPYHESSQFACNICTLIVREPKECSSCGSLYCSICIDQWLMSSK